jgi:SAM-dependent methyltransferase
VHDLAHRIAPKTAVVYVDNDETVCAHGRALLVDSGNVAVLQADLRRPDVVLNDRVVRGLIDLDRPVAVLAMFVLHLIPDEDEPQAVLARYRDALAPGSALAISHASDDSGLGNLAGVSAVYQRTGTPFVPRSHEEIRGFFGRFVLEPPGLVNFWPYPEPPAGIRPDLTRAGYCGIGRRTG